MIARHEALARRVAQDAALAAQGLGEEEARRAFEVEGRRVELHELHVRKLRARVEGHRHAVARRHRRVRRVQVELARAARREHHAARARRARRAHERVEVADARDATVSNDEALGLCVSEERDVALASGAREECADYLAPRRVAVRVQYARARVRGLAREQQAAPFAVELRAPLYEFGDVAPPFSDENLHGALVAEARARS